MHTYMHIQTYAHIHQGLGFRYANADLYTYTCSHTCTHTFTHMHTYAHIHAHIHAHTHAHIDHVFIYAYADLCTDMLM